MDSVELLDKEDEPNFWGIRIISPDGFRKSVSARFVESVNKAGDREEARSNIRKSPFVKSFELSKDFSYKRKLNLSKLCDFSEIGTYKVQLLYDNSNIAYHDKGEWSGGFTGQVFEVNISE